ncbi:MAG: hypothetical protein IJ354_01425 [Clostridia bacterium]|nr:hypothetical protein [Clostridia bacterium]
MLWLCGALALTVTWFGIMPSYVNRTPGVAQAAYLTAKVLPTAMAALFGCVAFILSGGTDRYALLIFLGLAVCAAADVLLDVKFVVGGALFFTGHLLYMAALTRCRKPDAWSLIVFVLSVAGLWLFCRRYFHLFPSRLLFAGVLVYCMALGMLLGFSLPLPFHALSRRSVLAALGAVLFVLSDMGTCHTILTPVSKTFDRCSLGVYYTAQFLLAMSAF